VKDQPHVMMAFACEDVASEPGKPISFQHVLDGIEAADFPAPTGRWFAVFCFYNPFEREIDNCRVLISHESGELVAQMAVRALRFTENGPLSRNVVAFSGFTWPYPGWYHVDFVAGKDDVLATFPMLVQHAAASGEEELPEET
jgi:hypothetical protein